MKEGNRKMENGATFGSIDVFATSPQSINVSKEAYVRNVIDVARWSEQSDCKGILIYADNGLVDPWLVAQIVIQNTQRLCPLVAVQPIYMHPYAVAKMVASLSHFYGRQIYLNMIAGGFKNDLIALNDDTPHDKRYDRLVEYTLLIKKLLEGGAVSHRGEFYTVDKLKLNPSLPKELFPGIFVSGSSEAGLNAAMAIGATAIKYPKPVKEYEGAPVSDAVDAGIRIGVIAREKEEEAWKVAHDRFPEDRKGQITHQVAMKVSDSVWHKQLSALGEESAAEKSPYWLIPFQNYKTFCPYLVGSYRGVAEELKGYMKAGYKRFILDIPPSEEELHHIDIVFRQAAKQEAM